MDLLACVVTKWLGRADKHSASSGQPPPPASPSPSKTASTGMLLSASDTPDLSATPTQLLSACCDSVPVWMIVVCNHCCSDGYYGVTSHVHQVAPNWIASAATARSSYTTWHACVKELLEVDACFSTERQQV